MARSRALSWGALFSSVVLVSACFQATRASQETAELDPEEVVQTIRVEVSVGAGDVALNEPLALDLGLGFPLRLAPLGQVEGAISPFGVYPRSGSSEAAPGGTVAFEFSVVGDPGLDILGTSELLSGIQVGDIRRIGFASRGENNWILGGYRIEVNGKTLFEKADVQSSAFEARKSATERLETIATELSVRQQEIADLESLVAADLASDEDRARLESVRAEIAPVVAEQSRLNRQTEGAFPWYQETGFQPAWAIGAPVGTAKVTVVTAPHTGAESRNFVYFQAGGHRYLIGSPSHPLTPNNGPQEFVLDMQQSPLTAGDLRSFGLGMIACELTQGDTADRWHPQRLIFEVDERVIYDSENSPLDAASLAAIRIIPPAHFNSDGDVVTNSPGVRETLLWEAGRGQGLDLINGGTEELPEPGSSDAPAAEPGLGSDSTEIDIIVDNGWYDPWAPPFPGEEGFGPGWAPGSPWPPGWGPGWGPAWPPGWVPGGGFPGLTWQDLILLGILDELGLLPGWVIPPPIGTPPQIEKVTINNLTNEFDWEVTGDATQIDHFSAELLLMRPDQAIPFATPISSEVVLPATARTISLLDFPPFPIPGTFDDTSKSYVVCRVSMVPTDPAVGADIAFTSLFPLRTTDPSLNFVVSPTFRFEPLMGMPVNRPVSFGGEPGLSPESVWVTGETDTHSGLVFAGFSPVQHHLALRASGDGDHLTAEVRGEIEGKYRVIAMLGYLGLPDIPSSVVDVTTHCLVYELANPANQTSFMVSTPLTVTPMMGSEPMVPIVIDVDTAVDVGPGAMGIIVSFELDATHVDPLHPPVLTGIRLLQIP